MRGGQRGLMLALPLLFVGLVARFPAGLAVYWITTSLWTLGQQTCLWRLAPAAASIPAPPPPERHEVRRSAPPRRTRKRKHGRRR
jgi:YidC/Oxa1 family membrane protein insertase